MANLPGGTFDSRRPPFNPALFKSDIPYDHLFKVVRILVMSAARHSPKLERLAAHILRAHLDKFQKHVYTFTLPFLRQAAILTCAVITTPLPHPTTAGFDATEYEWTPYISLYCLNFLIMKAYKLSSPGEFDVWRPPLSLRD